MADAWTGAPSTTGVRSDTRVDSDPNAPANTASIPGGSQLFLQLGDRSIYVAPDGSAYFVNRATGQLEEHQTAEQWAATQQANSTEPFTADSLRHGARDAKENILDEGNVVGTPLIDDSNQDKVTETVLGGNGGVPDVIGPNGEVNIPGVTGGPAFSLGAGITDPIQAAIARQNAIADQAGQDRANFTATGAPTIATPAAIQASLAQQQQAIQAQQAQAQQAQAANVARTALTPEQAAIQAQQIEAARIGQLQQAQVSNVGQTQVGPTAQAGAAQIDPALQAQIRQSQMGLVSGLEGAIAGKEPSAAEIMLRNATDRNVANQYALAQAATGMNTGLAQRTAMINAADASQQAIMQQALLRAQEIAAARGQLGGVLDSARGADIGLATNQAGLQQQANLANTGALNTSTLTQAQLSQQAAIQQAQLQQGASQFNAGQSNDAATANATLAQQAALANQQASMQAGTQNATLAQQVALANAGAQNQTYQQNAQLQQAANLQNAQLGTQASITNANNVTGANTASAQLANAVNLANAQNQSQANLATGQIQTQAAIANAGNAVATNNLNQKAQQDLAANQLTASGQAGQTSIGYGDVAAKMAEAEAKRQAALIGGISAGAAALISDPRQKTDIHPAEAEIAEFTAALDPKSWRYKDPNRPGAAPGKRYGIMTTDLERSAIGRSLVRELEDGTKAVDVPQSIGAILATLSAMSKRQDRIEARR